MSDKNENKPTTVEDEAKKNDRLKRLHQLRMRQVKKVYLLLQN
jgi:hypothetical protein